MIHGKKVVVVLPAYNASSTLEMTYLEIPFDIVDEVIMVDDASTDSTVAVAKKLGIRTFVHEKNLGYGGNQKTCYREALSLGADVVIMLHPDYQYTPKLIGAMASLVAIGQYDLVLGSRIISGGAVAGGMPIYKYIANRFLTWAENILLGKKISEYHTGYRAFSRRLLQTLPLHQNSDDFVFDNEQKFFYLIMFFVILAVFFAKNLVRGRVGRAFIAIRDNDLAAELMGINIFKYKLFAFIACSAYAGLAGSLFAAYYGYVSADQFTLSESVWYIGYLIVGGLGSITGAIFGVVFLKVVEFILRGIGPTISDLLPAIGTSFLSSSLVMVFGLVIILFLIFEPRGLYHRWELTKASIRFWPFTY